MTTYREVNAAWPDPMPVPTPHEAIAGVKRLVKLAHRHAREEGIHFGLPRYTYRATSGKRHTYVRRYTWHVNPDYRGWRNYPGWQGIVHGVSHWAQRKYWPEESPHGPRHVWIERMLTEYAVKNFLDGQLKSRARPKPLTNKIDVRAQRVAAAIKRWEAKVRRAQNALRKLRRQERYYARRPTHPAVPRPVDTGEPGAMGEGTIKLAA